MAEPVPFATPRTSLNAAALLLPDADDPRPALVSEGGEITRGDLHRAMNRAANGFRALGLARGSRVLMVARNDPAMVAAWLGAVKAGLVPVSADPHLPPSVLNDLAEVRGASLVLADADAPLANRPFVWRLGGPDDAGHCWNHWTAQQSDAAEAADTAPDDPAFWIGNVVHAQRAVTACDRYPRAALGLAAGDRMVAAFRLFTTDGLLHGLLAPLRLAASAVLDETPWPDAGRVLELVRRHRPRALFGTPLLFRDLLKSGAGADEAVRDTALFVASGEKLPATLYDRWLKTVGRPILEAYGCAETLCPVIGATPDDSRPGWTGRLLPDAEARLVDDAGEPAPPEEAGILMVRHPSLCLGYHGRNGWLDPAPVAGGWFLTRDVFTGDGTGWWRHIERRNGNSRVAAPPR
ncbi:MAG TPA: AMP-binding protein [Azospirillaceae bacterium]|nr:AMP-binding protein [Azospirillaceae bacterium]